MLFQICRENPGGCFFAAASFEFDGRPGPVREAIVKRSVRRLEHLGYQVTLQEPVAA